MVSQNWPSGRESSVRGSSQWRDLISLKHSVFYAMVAQSVFHPTVKHTHARIQTTLLFLVLKQCHLLRVFHINNTLLSFAWMGMWCWLRWELPDLYLFKNSHTFHMKSVSVGEANCISGSSWFTPESYPWKYQENDNLKAFFLVSVDMLTLNRHYSSGMIYQSLIEKIKLWKGLFPLVVWSVDGVTVTFACVCLLKMFWHLSVFSLDFYSSYLSFSNLVFLFVLNLLHML